MAERRALSARRTSADPKAPAGSGAGSAAERPWSGTFCPRHFVSIKLYQEERRIRKTVTKMNNSPRGMACPFFLKFAQPCGAPSLPPHAKLTWGLEKVRVAWLECRRTQACFRARRIHCVERGLQFRERAKKGKGPGALRSPNASRKPGTNSRSIWVWFSS